jgi:hypothetical protein
VELNVNHEQNQYISQHEYYADNTVNIKSGSYNANQDRYYDVTDPDVRLPLYLLMTRYGREDADNDYVVSATSPMYVDPKDCSGIDIPALPSLPLNESKFHTNQQLKLVITDVDTNSKSAGVHAFSVLAH